MIAVAILALVLPAAATFALAPELTLSPTSAVGGSTVTVAGVGFPAHEWGQLTLDDSPDGMPRYRSDTTGSFTVTFDVPAGTAIGQHRVSAVQDGPSPAFDPSAPLLASTSLDVLAAPAPAPTSAPTVAPTVAPTTAPTAAPTTAPTAAPTTAPTAAPTAAPTPAPTPAAAAIDHVFVIAEENHSYSEIVGSSAAPYLNSLISQGALATAYHGVGRPSLPNYLALVGGSTFGITTNCLPTDCPINARNLGDSLESAGRSWRSYHEAMPSPCYLSDSGTYRVHHNPFAYFDDVRTDPTRCATHDVPYTALGTDLATEATTPSFSLIVPDNCNDMHDCSIATGDGWLSREIPRIFASPAWKSGTSLLVVTFDEDDGSEGNRVLTLFVGPAAKTGYRSATSYDHYSLLRTIEDVLGAPTLTSYDGAASPMTDLLK